MGVGEQSVTRKRSRHCLQPKDRHEMQDNPATIKEEGALVSRRIGAITKNIYMDYLDDTKGALKSIETEDRQKVEHKKKNKVAGHTHPRHCYQTILTCAGEASSDNQEPMPKREKIT